MGPYKGNRLAILHRAVMRWTWIARLDFATSSKQDPDLGVAQRSIQGVTSPCLCLWSCLQFLRPYLHWLKQRRLPPKMAEKTPDKSNPAAETPPTSPGSVDVAFPPDEEGVSSLIGYCGKGNLPAYFGEEVSVEKYNDWLLNKEDGLRVSYDKDKRKVLLREGCYRSHGTTRLELMIAMKMAFAPHGYVGGFGQITTPVGQQNVTPDAWLGSGIGVYPVLAEVGQSQSETQLNERADQLLTLVPGTRVIILIKIFDAADNENGRMVAWCATHDARGNLTSTPEVEFGRVGPGGGPVVAWAVGAPAPFVTVPAHNNVPATNVPLGGILTALRANGGMCWHNGLPP